MIFNVLMDMGKLKKPYSGLGQFSYNYGKYIMRKNEASLQWNFLVHKSRIGIFGQNNKYERITLKRRYIPSLCQKYHLWHALHQDSAYLPSDQYSPFILTIHDLNFLKEKNTFTAERRLKQLQNKVDRASAITFISNYTASVSKENLNLDGKDLYVIHNGVEIDTEKPVKEPLFLPAGKFLFSLGMVLKKKNFHVLIDFIRQLPEYNLVIAGDNTDIYAKRIQKRVLKYKLQDRVILPGIISEDDKTYLYKNCKAFLFPSKMEGFGLPVIEAMRFGKPVFISEHTSLPEIGGDLAYYWKSFYPNNMVNQFKHKLKEFEIDQENLSRKIIDYSNQYTWDNSIEKYFTLYVNEINKHYESSSIQVDSIAPIKSITIQELDDVHDLIKVLHISTERPWKGGEQQIAYTIDELNYTGVQNFIACDKGSGFEKYCINHNWYHYAFKLNSAFNLVSAFRISQICRKNNIDIIHVHTSVGHTLGVMSTYFGHKAKIVLSRRVINPIKNNTLSKWKYNHHRIAKIIAVSEATKNILGKNLTRMDNCIVIHDGIDPARFSMSENNSLLRKKYHINPEAYIIGNTSALIEVKDYITFINTAEYLLMNNLNAQFFIIGDGPERKKIEKYIKSKKLSDKIILTGFITNVPEILTEFDVFLMTSKEEGLGSSILDAFVCGIPVVATNAGGIPEAVIHKKTGLLSEVMDYVSLGDNVLKLINDENLRKQIIQNATNHLQDSFTKKIMGEEILAVYKEIYHTGN